MRRGIHRVTIGRSTHVSLGFVALLAACAKHSPDSSLLSSVPPAIAGATNLEVGEIATLEIDVPPQSITWTITSTAPVTPPGEGNRPGGRENRLEGTGPRATLYALAPGTFKIEAHGSQFSARPLEVSISPLEYHLGAPVSFPVASSNAEDGEVGEKFLGRDLTIAGQGDDAAIYVALTLKGAYTRFSKRTLEGSPLAFSAGQTGEGGEPGDLGPAWPPEDQLRMRTVVADTVGAVYAFVGPPGAGLASFDNSDSVRKYVLMDGSYERVGGWSVPQAFTYNRALAMDEDTLYTLVGDGITVTEVLRLDVDGNPLDLEDGQPMETAAIRIVDGVDLDDVESIAVGGHDSIFIASGASIEKYELLSLEAGAGARREYQRDATFSYRPCTGDGPCPAVWDVALDSKGRVYSSWDPEETAAIGGGDAGGRGSIRVVNAVGEEVQVITTVGQHEVRKPKAFAVAPDGGLRVLDEYVDDGVASRILVARKVAPPTTLFSIAPPGGVFRAGTSREFNASGLMLDEVDRLRWETRGGTLRDRVSTSVRVVGGGSYGSYQLRAYVEGTDKEAFATITLTQFNTHGFRVPFAAPGQNDSPADGDLACGGPFLWVALNDSLSGSLVQRLRLDTDGSIGQLTFFSDAIWTQNFDGENATLTANVACDALGNAFWIDQIEGQPFHLHRAGFEAQETQTFEIGDDGAGFNGCIAATGPIQGGVSVVYAAAVPDGTPQLMRIEVSDNAASAPSFVSNLPFTPDHLAIDAVGGLVFADARTIARLLPDGQLDSGFLIPEVLSGVRDVSVDADDLLYVATWDSSSESSIRVFNHAARSDDGANETVRLMRFSEYERAAGPSHENPETLFDLQGMAVAPDGNIFALDDIEPTDNLCNDLAILVRIAPDGLAGVVSGCR